ncbi:iron chelate uptake ABC transporter family permease subunit, partial [Streptomyces sp. NPDC058461]
MPKATPSHDGTPQAWDRPAEPPAPPLIPRAPAESTTDTGLPATTADPGLPASTADTVRRLRGAHRAAVRRTVVVAVALAVVLLGLLAASLLLGGLRGITGADVLPAAFGLRTGLADYVMHGIRFPRALTALLSGALFGLSGALYQRLIRNPLATPDIVGISAGAGAGAVTVLLYAPAFAFGVEAAAVGGAFAMVGLVLALSRRGGRVDTYRLVLIGIGMAAVCTAYVNYLLTAAGEQS